MLAAGNCPRQTRQEHKVLQAVVAWNGEVAVLAFRGTQSLANVRTDAKVSILPVQATPEHTASPLSSAGLSITLTLKAYVAGLESRAPATAGPLLAGHPANGAPGLPARLDRQRPGPAGAGPLPQGAGSRHRPQGEPAGLPHRSAAHQSTCASHCLMVLPGLVALVPAHQPICSSSRGKACLERASLMHGRPNSASIRVDFDDPQWKVCRAGHSLGGAIATLAAFDIQKTFDRLPRLTVMTFGAPRTGNAAFAQEFGQLVPNCWHVINDK